MSKWVSEWASEWREGEKKDAWLVGSVSECVYKWECGCVCMWWGSMLVGVENGYCWLGSWSNKRLYSPLASIINVHRSSTFSIWLSYRRKKKKPLDPGSFRCHTIDDLWFLWRINNQNYVKDGHKLNFYTRWNVISTRFLTPKLSGVNSVCVEELYLRIDQISNAQIISDAVLVSVYNMARAFAMIRQ